MIARLHHHAHHHHHARTGRGDVRVREVTG
jgi:hypothetical protein